MNEFNVIILIASFLRNLNYKIQILAGKQIENLCQCWFWNKFEFSNLVLSDWEFTIYFNWFKIVMDRVFKCQISTLSNGLNTSWTTLFYNFWWYFKVPQCLWRASLWKIFNKWQKLYKCLVQLAFNSLLKAETWLWKPGLSLIVQTMKSQKGKYISYWKNCCLCSFSSSIPCPCLSVSQNQINPNPFWVLIWSKENMKINCGEMKNI